MAYKILKSVTSVTQHFVHLRSTVQSTLDTAGVSTRQKQIDISHRPALIFRPALTLPTVIFDALRIKFSSFKLS
jgi:hypothetical protein